MSHIKVHITLERIDRWVNLLAFVAMTILIAMPLYWYDKLPDTIPIHFNMSGQADGFGSKGSIWILPLVGFILYVGLSVLVRYPHHFNYAAQIKSQNAKQQYRSATGLIRFLNLLITAVFAYLSISTVYTAMGNQEGLGSAFIWVFYSIVFVTLGYFMTKLVARQ